MVKFQLQAVPVGVGIHGDGGKAGVPFRPDRDALQLFAVDHHVANKVFLRHDVCLHTVPFGGVHLNIDTYDRIGIEKFGCILHPDALTAEQSGQFIRIRSGQKTENDGDGHDGNDDF